MTKTHPLFSWESGTPSVPCINTSPLHLLPVNACSLLSPLYLPLPPHHYHLYFLPIINSSSTPPWQSLHHPNLPTIQKIPHPQAKTLLSTFRPTLQLTLISCWRSPPAPLAAWSRTTLYKYQQTQTNTISPLTLLHVIHSALVFMKEIPELSYKTWYFQIFLSK